MPQVEQQKSPFIVGYFTQQYGKGNRPETSEPQSSLPSIQPDVSMEVQTGFVVALKNRSE
ncbi:MAG: hypothetical protein WAV21_01775 [Minisyncoccia bacterium]